MLSNTDLWNRYGTPAYTGVKGGARERRFAYNAYVFHQFTTSLNQIIPDTDANKTLILTGMDQLLTYVNSAVANLPNT